MKKIIIATIMFICFAGVVSASSLNGNYNGNPIVKLKSKGTVVDTGDVPAIIYEGSTLVPISALRNLGADVTWDANTYSVDVKLPESDINKKLDKLNGNIFISKNNGVVTASSIFTQKIDVNGDWLEIWGLIWSISESLSPEVAKVDYYDKNSKYKGSISIKNNILVGFKNGTVSSEQFDKSYEVTGELYGTTLSKAPMTAKEIAKLKDRVGFVLSFDRNQKTLAQGSGFMIKPGIFITNYHVAGNTGGLRIQLDGNKYDTFGEFLFGNSFTDTFGVVIASQHDDTGKIIGGYPTKMLDYTVTLPEVGDKVYAIGSPQGLENTFSEGIVSAIRNQNGLTMIQHTANTDHGSSGGVLLNEYGQAIGITSSGIDGTPLDFAIPMMYVQQELDKR